jgi:sugar phosphate isomerase/epimerase
MIGFTSRTFKTAIAKGVTTLSEVISWAAAQRFPWLEVRDGNLALSEEELRGLKVIADGGGVRLHYAWDGTNILDPGDGEAFLRGVKNSAVFGPDTFARLTIAGRVIRDNPSRIGYSHAELDTLRERIEGRIRTAGERRVRLVFENSHEPTTAARSGEVGIHELLAAIPAMNLTFDPGNFMDREHNRSYCDAPALKRFYRENRNRLPYVHVKMTRDNIVQPTLIEDGDLEPGFYRQMLADGKLVCIELSEADELRECRRRILDARRMLTEGPVP